MVYENGLSERLKALFMQDSVVAWLPKATVERELASGSIVCFGEEDLFIDLKINTYRNKEQPSDLSDAMWRIL